jgi:hypothetical protein
MRMLLRILLLAALMIAGKVQAQAQRQDPFTQPQAGFIVIETSLPTADYASFALAQNSASFSEDSEENKGLLDKGFGFPVRVRRVMDGYIYALAASPRLLVPVPFGWRGFDDGKRTRLFTPAGNIGIVINAMPMEGFETWDDTREQVWKLARQTAEERAKKDPRYQARLIKLSDGTFGMRETNIYDGEDDPYSSVILFRQHPDDPRTAIRMNLFAPVGDFDRHLALAALVMKDMQGAFIPVGLDRDISKIPQSESPMGRKKP